MTAIGRALMARPKMILLDEPSMGLAPQLVEEIFEIVKELNAKEKVSFLLAEQNTNIALRYADYGYILENGRVVMDGEGSDAGAERGREGVLPRLFLGRPQELPRREVLPPPQALALKKPPADHFDRLETRSPKQREAALLAALPKLIAHAKRRAPGFARILEKIKPEKIRSRAALAALPVTRKSDLRGLQAQERPLGGLNATPVAKLAKIFMSPGPIYEPEGRAQGLVAHRARAVRGRLPRGRPGRQHLRLPLHAGRLDARIGRAARSAAPWCRPAPARPRCRSRRSATCRSTATSARLRS